MTNPLTRRRVVAPLRALIVAMKRSGPWHIMPTGYAALFPAPLCGDRTATLESRSPFIQAQPVLLRGRLGRDLRLCEGCRRDYNQRKWAAYVPRPPCEDHHVEVDAARFFEEWAKDTWAASAAAQARRLGRELDEAIEIIVNMMWPEADEGKRDTFRDNMRIELARRARESKGDNGSDPA